MSEQTNPEQSNSEPRENAAEYAAARVDTIHGLIEAFCYSKRDVPGFVGVTVRLDEWRVTVPLSEFYGLLDRLAGSRSLSPSNCQRIEDLEHALKWALTYISAGTDCPTEGDGELFEDYSGATRIAWPDEPEQWA